MTDIQFTDLMQTINACVVVVIYGLGFIGGQQ